jgi:hypothetical protein
MEGYDIPLTGLNLKVLSISTLGTKKAIVFPLPVLAAPRTSLPASKGGIVLAWTSVMVSKPILWIASEVGGERLRVEKETRSYGAGASSVTFEELGVGSAAAAASASEASSLSLAAAAGVWAVVAEAEALEDLLRFLLGLLASPRGGLDVTADMMVVGIKSRTITVQIDAWLYSGLQLWARHDLTTF